MKKASIYCSQCRRYMLKGAYRALKMITIRRLLFSLKLGATTRPRLCVAEEPFWDSGNGNLAGGQGLVFLKELVL